jgi:hypothetical protein
MKKYISRHISLREKRPGRVLDEEIRPETYFSKRKTSGTNPRRRKRPETDFSLRNRPGWYFQRKMPPETNFSLRNRPGRNFRRIKVEKNFQINPKFRIESVQFGFFLVRIELQSEKNLNRSENFSD